MLRSPSSLLPQLCCLFVATLTVSHSARASQRHFGFIQESAVLNPGSTEIEPWTTFRFGREHYYSRFDTRLELEYGVLQNLQAAFYWNFSALAQDVVEPGMPSERRSSFEFQSASAEWKYKLSDPVADALGSGLYFEASLGPTEAELEARLIADKQFGGLLIAGNVVGEREWEFATGTETETESTLELVAGVGYFVTPAFVPGLALRSLSNFGDDLERSVLYAGPSVAVAREGWWANLSFEPQLVAFKGKTPGRRLDLADNEKVQVRVLLGFDL